MRSIETTAAKLSVFKMTWPIFIEILLQMMVGNVDQFMLSHYSQKSRQSNHQHRYYCPQRNKYGRNNPDCPIPWCR